MPVAPTYPGVYVEELPSGVHTITGVSTAVTAFIGNFPQGPLNQPVTTFSVADVERTFGPLASNSEAGYGVRQFFANGGAQAVIVRVAPGNPPTSSIQLGSAKNTAVLKADAANPGKWGDSIRLSVDYDTTDPTSRFNLTVTRVDSSSSPVTLATEIYRNLSMNPNDANFAVAVVNDASSLIHLSLVGTPTDLPAPTQTRSGDIAAVDVANLQGLETTVMVNGAPAGKLKLAANAKSLTELASMLQAALRALGSPAVLPSVTVQLLNGPNTEQHLQFATSDGHPEATLAFKDDTSTAETLAKTLKLDGVPGNVQQYVLGGAVAGAATASVHGDDGTNGGLPDATALLGDAGAHTGMHALDTTDFNLLCIPDTSRLSDDEASAVVSAATSYCQSRWAFLIVDPPQETPDQDGTGQRDKLLGIQQWLAAKATLRSSYSALYYPRPRIPDPLNGFRLRPVAASGTIAGLYARTDTERGVWKAPAGTTATLVNVPALTYQLTDAENGVLNPLGINCLRNLPVYGNVSWGARTLDGADQLASDWKYVPVRRLALYLEASLFRGTQWVVFEPNDEPLWSQVRLNVGTFMQQLFRQGAFQGSTPSSAYFVRCDSTTTTQADINLGVVNIVVGFAPLKPAEFVVLQIQQIAGQTPS
jgi:phage tail sheath protein FI